jgi:XRE family transcriptional regulator, aerobic/anaerobic benzoate catabolism transcriptional regulator
VQEARRTAAEKLDPPANGSAAGETVSVQRFLRMLGERVRNIRAREDMTRKQLAKASGVSERYLAQLESGKGNVSILLLRRISAALKLSLDALVADGPERSADWVSAVEILRHLSPGQLQQAHQTLMEKFASQETNGRLSRVALIGLRGAGKSTLGGVLAERLDVPFLELDRVIEQENGLTLGAIFDLYGQAGFHRLERQCLEHVLERYPRFVLATGGGLVAERSTYDALLAQCYTVWLRATPEEHMNRVIAQGDKRPMAANPQAMADLRRILAGREPLYARADLTLETTGKTVQEVLQELLQAVHPGVQAA